MGLPKFTNTTPKGTVGCFVGLPKFTNTTSKGTAGCFEGLPKFNYTTLKGTVGCFVGLPKFNYTTIKGTPGCLVGFPNFNYTTIKGTPGCLWGPPEFRSRPDNSTQHVLAQLRSPQRASELDHWPHESHLQPPSKYLWKCTGNFGINGFLRSDLSYHGNLSFSICSWDINKLS